MRSCKIWAVASYIPFLSTCRVSFSCWWAEDIFLTLPSAFSSASARPFSTLYFTPSIDDVRFVLISTISERSRASVCSATFLLSSTSSFISSCARTCPSRAFAVLSTFVHIFRSYSIDSGSTLDWIASSSALCSGLSSLKRRCGARIGLRSTSPLSGHLRALPRPPAPSPRRIGCASHPGVPPGVPMLDSETESSGLMNLSACNSDISAIPTSLYISCCVNSNTRFALLIVICENDLPNTV